MAAVAPMAKIEDAIDYVLQNEGGFTIDDGGPTMWGIVRADVAKYRRVPIGTITTDDMKHLTKTEATEIYRSQYWDVMNLDQIIQQNVATAIFDVGVNRGVTVGAIYAKKVASMSGWPLAMSGTLDLQSIKAINSVFGPVFIKRLEALDMAGYTALVDADPAKYGRYLKGWTARAERLLTLA